MAEYFFNVVRPSRIAGGLLVVSAVVDYFAENKLGIVTAGLGLGLCAVEDTSTIDALRLVVFGWVLLSLLFVLPAAFSGGMWVPAIRTALFGGAVAGLMLERLTEPTIGILALVGFGALLF